MSAGSQKTLASVAILEKTRVTFDLAATATRLINIVWAILKKGTNWTF
jgi:hypothetical protein